MHCKAGLGRTGVLICAYMIKHFGFTAEEAIGYIRICRPGSVIGPQQKFLISKAKQLAAEGQGYREALQVREYSVGVQRGISIACTAEAVLRYSEASPWSGALQRAAH